MNSVTLVFNGEELTARATGALFWRTESLLVVSDLHLGKSERMARRGGALLPPYETLETLDRLAADLAETRARTVICLGDSFDDLAAGAALGPEHRDTIQRLQAGRRWVWIEGNHDPAPLDFGGTHLAELRLGALTFRHIADHAARPGEVSGHYHPKARMRAARRPCFMVDARRMILPAYGCYTGGLDWTTPVLRDLFDDKAIAYLTGPRILAVPVPRAA
jgi:DNA ligase-associated metallophosphoesterase